MYKENIMLNFLKKLFGVYEAPKVEAPYKVETPAVEEVKGPAKCGCGRSPTGNCVGLHALADDAWAVHPDNPNRVVVTEAPVVAEAPAPVAKKAKAPAKPKAPKATKEAPKKAPAKPRKPKTKQ